MIKWTQRPSGMHKAECGDLTLIAFEGRGDLSFRAIVEIESEPLLDGFDYPTLDAAKLAAETFAREWVAAQASALGDGWIPVGERLPERGVAVLAVYVSPIRSDRRIDVMWNGYNGWHAGGAESVTVTHWRPLPPPPVAEVEE